MAPKTFEEVFLAESPQEPPPAGVACGCWPTQIGTGGTGGQRCRPTKRTRIGFARDPKKDLRALYPRVYPPVQRKKDFFENFPEFFFNKLQGSCASSFQKKLKNPKK